MEYDRLIIHMKDKDAAMEEVKSCAGTGHSQEVARQQHLLT
jgi:hypothetical protein